MRVKLKNFFLSSLAILTLLLVFAAGLLAWPLAEMPNIARQGNFLIQNVSVLDTVAGTAREGRDIVILQGKIFSDTPTGSQRSDTPTITIDGTGKYLMPGLWDMHTHSLKISPQYMHPLFIANGVTGVRDMSGCMSEPDSFFACIEDRESWNRSIRDQGRISPRYVLQSSFQINGGNEVPDGYPSFFRAETEEDADQLVRFYQQNGADFLKIYTELSQEAYQTLAGAARNKGLDLAGHRPLRVSLENLLLAGQRSIEHPRLFLLECFRDAEKFRALDDPLAAYNAELRWQLVDGQDTKRCRKLMWEPDIERAAAQTVDAAGRELYPEMYQMAQEHVRQAYYIGVKILVGTDAGDTYVFPGFSVHDELAELVRGGVPPAAAIRSATLDAAAYAGLEDDFGSITVGKAGDLLLLDANPLENIAHTQKISGVFFNGYFFNRAALNKLLRFAEKQAGSLRVGLHLLWGGLNSPLFRVQLAD